MLFKIYEDENVIDDELDIDLDIEGVVEFDDEFFQKVSFFVFYIFFDDYICDQFFCFVVLWLYIFFVGCKVEIYNLYISIFVVILLVNLFIQYQDMVLCICSKIFFIFFE